MNQKDQKYFEGNSSTSSRKKNNHKYNPEPHSRVVEETEKLNLEMALSRVGGFGLF